jgi:hypothetical protein
MNNKNGAGYNPDVEDVGVTNTGAIESPIQFCGCAECRCYYKTFKKIKRV